MADYTSDDNQEKKPPNGKRRLDEQKLLAAIDAKLTNAYGSETDSDLAKHREKIIEAYLGLNTNPAPEGRSQIVDRGVFETVSTILPSLVRIFAGSSDEVCKFVPVGPEDEPSAELTTAYINHVVTQKNPWEQICADWIFDAALHPNSYAMAYWEEEEFDEETYEGQSEDQVAFLLQDQELEIISASHAEEGYTVVVRRRPKGKVKLCVLPPENCLVDGDTPDWQLRDADFFEYREDKTIADLIGMGFDVPPDVSDNIDKDLDDTPEGIARDRFGEDQHRDGEGTGLMRRVKTRMVWVKCDCYDEGEAKLHYAVLVGRNVLKYKDGGYACESVTRINVASMTAQPMPHRHPGMSIAESVLDQQELKTTIKRGAIDNLVLANNGRHVVSNEVHLEDFLDSRPGGLVRMKPGSPALPASGHVMPLVHPFAFDQIVGALEYFDSERQNRSGASRYFAGTDAGAINKTASGVAQLTNQAAQRVEHHARMMAPAFEELFNIAHELILKHNNKQDIIKLKGQWVPIDPRSWQTKRDCRISVGVGAGNSDSMKAALMAQVQMQLALMPAGIVQPDNLRNTVIEISKLNGFANPDKFWSRPGPPPITPEQAQQMQQAMQQVGQENLKLKADNEVKRVEVAKKDLQLQVAQVEQKFIAKNVELAGKELGVREQGMAVREKGIGQEVQRAEQQIADQQAKEQDVKAEFDQLVQALMKSAEMQAESAQMVAQAMSQAAQSMQQAAQIMAADTEIVRDEKTGRAMGARRVMPTVQ